MVNNRYRDAVDPASVSPPDHVQIQTVTGCNANCIFCPNGKTQRRVPLGRRMDWDLYAQIVDEFSAISRERGFRPTLTYCYMAEPFLAENLEQYVECALCRGIKVHLKTNAAAMRPGLSRAPGGDTTPAPSRATNSTARPTRRTTSARRCGCRRPAHRPPFSPVCRSCHWWPQASS